MGVTKSTELAESFKKEWVMENYVPKCVESYNTDQQGYNYRMCALMSLSAVMPVLQADSITNTIVPTFLKAT